ncbi:MAG: MBL fold metallo-hydrolase [Candidatus Liptonbacteria bacterium]|nr:MBL fold metallo-hydrolase [Candidatus Liptonbacteria bacterium]
MKITKFGHSCFLAEEGEARILFDPGDFSVLQNESAGVDAVIITHEHQDHFDPESLRTILARNPNAKVITNNGVAAKLDRGVSYELLEDGQSTRVKGVLIEGFGKDHAIIYPSLPRVANTGYFVASRLFYPGDSFTTPQKAVEVLALPAFAPWSKIQETIDYAKNVMPGACFPVHDGILARQDFVPRVVGSILGSQGIKFVPLEIGKSTEF